MVAFIKIEDMSVRFRMYRNKSVTLKEAVIGHFSSQPDVEQVIEFSALKNINLSIENGERLGIIGLNGAGKSTLLRTIVGIYPPHTGKITVRGRITPLIELGTGFDLELSGRENIFLNGALLRRSRQEMEEIASDIIDFSELDEFIDLPVKYYSSGMYSRLAFSIGTKVEPEILLLDEVFAAGDAHFVKKASTHLNDLVHQSNIVILVSHDHERLADICHKVIVLHKGEIINQGIPRDMIKFYLHEIAV